MSFLLATAGACFILQVPLRQLMSSTGKGSPKSCHLSLSPASSSLQTSTTIWSSMSFLLLLLHHVKDPAADVVTTPQQHHVETFVGMFVRNPSLTFLLAFKMCALNWIHMGQWHVRDVWFYLRFVLMPVYILQSQSGTFGKHVLVVPWKPNVPKVMCSNILCTFIDFSSWKPQSKDGNQWLMVK